MLLLRRAGPLSFQPHALTGHIGVILALLATPIQAHGQDMGLLPDNGRPSSVQEAPGAHGNTRIGLAAGVTVASVGVPLALGASTCTGSGDYLRTCRLIFAGAVLVGGGVGSLVGRTIQSEGSAGRATAIMVGSALGAVGAFLVSLPFCRQEEVGNPEMLCGYDGMTEPGTVAGGAAVGALLGFLLFGGSDNVTVTHLGPVPMSDGRSALGLGLSVAR